MSESHIGSIRRRIAALHAAARRRQPDPRSDLVVLVTAVGVNLTLRALVEARRMGDARRA